MEFILIFFVFFLVMINISKLSKRVVALETKVSTMKYLLEKYRIQENKSESLLSVSDQDVAPSHQDDIKDASSIQKEKSVASFIVKPDIKQNVKSEPDVVAHFFAWIKEDTLMKFGALLLILALGWFTQYAFANNWIGPVGRISLGLIIGVVVLVGGYVRSLQYKSQGGVLLALGTAMILLVMFVAREVYDFFTPASSMAIMFSVVAFTTLVSMKFNNKVLAFGTIIMAALVPLLTNSPESSFAGLFTYLFVVATGSLWVVYMTGWRVLVLENFLVVMFYSLPYMGAEDENHLLAIFAFAMMFFVANIIGILKNNADLENRRADLLTAFGTGVLLFLWIFSTPISDGLQVLLLLGWALIFVTGSFVIFVQIKQKMPFLIYIGVAAAMVAFATSIMFSGAVLTIAYIFEAAIATVTVAWITRNQKSATTVAFLLFIIPLLVLLSYVLDIAQWTDNIFYEGAIAVYVAIGVLLATAGILAEIFNSDTDQQGDDYGEKDISLSQSLVMVASIFLLFLIWVIPHAIFYEYDGFATMISLFIYTAIGLYLYFMAYGHHIDAMHMIGKIILGGVVARLLLVDVWQLEIVGRIIVFSIIGVALISTALHRKNSE